MSCSRFSAPPWACGSNVCLTAADFRGRPAPRRAPPLLPLTPAI
ncbi:hypothetical protein RAN3_1881 [plant metagenome]|uniref:Uncharacterized protein n=1 Tax=plant metagenome TaxID=1297885 RepID=A0A484VAF1_9ZZZZ